MDASKFVDVLLNIEVEILEVQGKRSCLICRNIRIRIVSKENMGKGVEY